jgi:hypothetical protein
MRVEHSFVVAARSNHSVVTVSVVDLAAEMVALNSGQTSMMMTAV